MATNRTRAYLDGLVPELRQFVTAADILARLNGSFGEPPRRGLLLADDVGLGKTTVAALVAWVVASSGEGRSVRILAPNDVMVRRWREELLDHVVPLTRCAPHLDVRENRVKARRVERLSAGSIQVVKHSYASSDFNLSCDLLIVDEAHRAKGDQTAFSKALKRPRKHAKRILILTATPFSIRIDELQRMLALIGAEEALNRAMERGVLVQRAARSSPRGKVKIIGILKEHEAGVPVADLAASIRLLVFL
jgi:superfamily II DNA or RNA helicase